MKHCIGSKVTVGARAVETTDKAGCAVMAIVGVRLVLFGVIGVLLVHPVLEVARAAVVVALAVAVVLEIEAVVAVELSRAYSWPSTNI